MAQIDYKGELKINQISDEITKLLADDGATADNFGLSVSISAKPGGDCSRRSTWADGQCTIFRQPHSQDLPCV